MSPFAHKITHNRMLLFGIILLKHGRHFDYWNQNLNMRMRVCYLDCHESGSSLQLFYFHLLPIYWLFLVYGTSKSLLKFWRNNICYYLYRMVHYVFTVNLYPCTEGNVLCKDGTVTRNRNTVLLLDLLAGRKWCSVEDGFSYWSVRFFSLTGTNDLCCIKTICSGSLGRYRLATSDMCRIMLHPDNAFKHRLKHDRFQTICEINKLSKFYASGSLQSQI
jgi:hypothetical protein